MSDVTNMGSVRVSDFHIPSHIAQQQPGNGIADAAKELSKSRSEDKPHPGEGSESVLEEAQRLTHGPRQTDYGHPLDDYTRTAAMVSGMLAHKLKAPLTPHEMALVMVQVKLSRQIHRPKRDNMVDGAGYCWVADEILEEGFRRAGTNRAR